MKTEFTCWTEPGEPDLWHNSDWSGRVIMRESRGWMIVDVGQMDILHGPYSTLEAAIAAYYLIYS